MEKDDTDQEATFPKTPKIDVPLDIALSLSRPEELEKLQKYIASYLAKWDSGKV